MMKINRFAIISIFSAVFLAVGFSFCAAVKAEEPGFSKSNVIFYRTGDLQRPVVADVVHRYNPRLSESSVTRIISAITKESEEFGLDPFLITAVIAAESSFRPNVVSPCNAMGLMQLTKGVSQAFHLSNPFDIEQNIHGGSRYLHYLKQRFGVDELILAAYNAGPTRVARLKRIPRIRETLCYIKKIAGLRHLMSAEWDTAVQNILRTPVILPFSEGIFSDGQRQSIGNLADAEDGLKVKSVNFGFRLIHALSYCQKVSHPIIDNRRLFGYV